jgi:hypothetical protein
LLRAEVLFGHLQADSVAQLFDGLPKFETLEIHEEFEEAPPLAAAEALEGLAALTDLEAGALLAVEGTAPPVLAPLWRELDVLPHELDDAESLLDLAEEAIGEACHGRILH